MKQKKNIRKFVCFENHMPAHRACDWQQSIRGERQMRSIAEETRNCISNEANSMKRITTI